MKGKLLIGMVLVLASSLALVACAAGVSQEDYDAVVAERDAVQSDLDAAQVEIETLQSDLDEAQAQIEELQADAAQAAAYVEVLLLAMTMSEEPTAAEITELTAKMAATGDGELMTKWMTMGDLWQKSMTGEATEEEAQAAWIDWLSYVNEQIAKALGTEQ